MFSDTEGIGVYSNGQHLLYWTKVLLQAQIEFKQEGKIINIVSSPNGELPTTIDELNDLTQSAVNKFKRKYDIHSLRHTGITRYIKAGMPLELVRLLTGHSGFNTILTVYYHINQEELIEDWVTKNNVNFTDELDMHKNSELFIKKEILNEIDSNNPEEVLLILKKYKFFNQDNRTLTDKYEVDLETISKSEVLYWRPLTCGICTRQQCPQEVSARCSLCPYFITNYFYIKEIGFQMQLAMARVKKYSEIIIQNREKQLNELNFKLKESMNFEIENFIGWLEILSLANSSYKDLQEEKRKKGSDSLLPNKTQKDNAIFSILPAINIDHGYLEILSQAFKKNESRDEPLSDIINIMSNKIIHYAIKNNRYNDIQSFSNEDIIKWFLPEYDKIPKNWDCDERTKKELINLLNLLDNKQELEYKNENTFLTK